MMQDVLSDFAHLMEDQASRQLAEEMAKQESEESRVIVVYMPVY